MPRMSRIHFVIRFQKQKTNTELDLGAGRFDDGLRVLLALSANGLANDRRTLNVGIDRRISVLVRQSNINHRAALARSLELANLLGK